MKFEQALELIRDVPDFPKPGILFKDITPLLSNGDAFHAVTENFRPLHNHQL
jgi:adenine phosphoribosyltransferase